MQQGADTLVTNGVPETVTLEYKRDLPGSADADKREFLADVSAAGAYGRDDNEGVFGPPPPDRKPARSETYVAARKARVG